MPVDVFPDFTAPTVTILTEAHGMAPSEVETLVTFPIETSMNGAAGVRRVRSATAVGFSVVWVEFDWGTNIQVDRQIVAEKLGLVRGSLPPDVDQPIMAPQASAMGEVLFLAINSDKHSLFDLRTLADTTIRRRLLAVEGVAQVTPIGGDVKQYQVVLSPSKLQAYNISASEVAEALKQTNQNATAGIMVDGGQEFLGPGFGTGSTIGSDRRHRGHGPQGSADPRWSTWCGANWRGPETGHRLGDGQARCSTGHYQAAEHQYTGTDRATRPVAR